MVRNHAAKDPAVLVNPEKNVLTVKMSRFVKYRRQFEKIPTDHMDLVLKVLLSPVKWTH